MKKAFLFSVFTLVWGFLLKAQCPSGNLVFKTQAQIDSFKINFPNCIEVIGDISIHSVSPAITNLNGLSNLIKLDGDLIIIKNDSLVSLSGLSSLDQINGDLEISENLQIEDLDGLQNIKAISGNLRITLNKSLISIKQLSSITTLYEGLVIYENNKLLSLQGLENLTSIENELNINYNETLKDIKNLSSLKQLGGQLILTDNSLIKNLEGLEGLNQIGGNITIWENDSLVNLKGLENLTTANKNIFLSSNKHLKNIEALSNLTKINGELYIFNNDELQSLKGIDNIDYNTIESVTIEHSQILSDCAVKSICNYLQFTGPANVSGNANGCLTNDQILSKCSVSNTQILLNNLNVYPNPTSGILKIELPEQSITNLIITDMLGRLVFVCESPDDEIDITHLANGMYALQIQVGKNKLVKLVVKK